VGAAHGVGVRRRERVRCIENAHCEHADLLDQIVERHRLAQRLRAVVELRFKRLLEAARRRGPPRRRRGQPTLDAGVEPGVVPQHLASEIVWEERDRRPGHVADVSSSSRCTAPRGQAWPRGGSPAVIAARNDGWGCRS
jgi:hypothetical protein